MKEEANGLFKQHGAKYRQMMCWGVMQLFDDETEKFMAGTDKKIPIYKAKGIDDALLWELASNKEFKKLKPMNGGMIVDVVACEEFSNLAMTNDHIRPQSARASRRNFKEDDDSSGSGKHMSMDREAIEKMKDGKGSVKGGKKLQKIDSAKSMFDKEKEKEEEDLKRIQRTKSTGKIKSPREISKDKEKTEAGRQTIDPIQKEPPVANPAKLATPPPPKHFPPPPPNTNTQTPGQLPKGPGPAKQPLPGDVKGGVKLPMAKFPPGKFPLKGPPPKEGLVKGPPKEGMMKAPVKFGGPLPPPK